MKYTKDEDKFITICYNMKWTHTEIANELDRTPCAIKSRCQILGLTKKHRNHKQYVIELAKSEANMIVLEKYKGALNPILHECLNCRIQYKCAPNHKLEGNKCKFCTTSYGIIPNKPGITYLVYFPKINLYKIVRKEIIHKIYGMRLF